MDRGSRSRMERTEADVTMVDMVLMGRRKDEEVM
jgi:hypothetical protein